MPLNSAPNSCAVISCRGCSPSSNGIAYVPCSNRFAHTANPSRSQYRIFTRSRLRLANTNRCPANASSLRESVTSACNPSKLLRMSHGHAHRYTRTLAGRCIMRGLRELPTPCVALSRLRPLRCASDVPNAALTPSQPFPAPLACPSLPVRIAPEPAPLPAASATDRRTAALRRADGRSFPPFVHFASARRSPSSSARADPNICHLSWKVSSSPVCSNPSILNSGVHRALTLVTLCGLDIRFCSDMKKWLTWDGRRWVLNDARRVKALAKRTMRLMYAQATDIKDKDFREAAERHARKSE